MPTYPSSLTINFDNLNTLTQERYLGKMTDAIMKSTPLLAKWYDAGTKLDGGVYIKQPILHGEGPGGSFDGRSPIDVSGAQQFTAAIFQWKYYWWAGEISMADDVANSGAAAVESLIKNRYDVMEMSAKSSLSQGIHSAGTVATDIVGLQAAIAASGAYGNISATTYSWWRSTVTSMAATPLSDAQIQANLIGVATDGDRTPDFFAGNQAMYNLVYNLIEPMKRITNDDLGNLGFRNIMIHGRPFVIEPHAPDGVIYAVNTSTFDLFTHTNWNMKFLGWDHYFSPVVRHCFIFWAGNLACKSRRFNAKFTGVTS